MSTINSLQSISNVHVMAANCRHIRWGEQPGRVFIASAVLFLFADSAWATCGDYLAHPNGEMTAAKHSHGVADRAADDSESELPVAPCQGPGCRQAPTMPVAPPAAPTWTGPSNDHLLALPEQVRPPASSHAFSLFGVPSATDCCRRRVERPPQVAPFERVSV